MKKLIVFAAIAAMVIPFVSCNNKIDYGDGPQAKIEKAKYTEVAKKVTIKEGTASTTQGIKEIEFTDGGRYIITRNQGTKAEGDEILTGTYRIENLIYILENFGSVEFGSDGSLTITLSTGETVSGSYEEEDKLPESDFTRDIAHTWKIDGIDLSVVADGKNVGVSKPKGGCDLEVIGKELIEQAKNFGADISVDLSKLKGYNVKSLSFTTSNTFIVEFTGAPAFKANVSGISGYSFNYKLEVGSENELLNAEAECKFEPQTDKTAWLTVKVKGSDFNGKIIFFLSVID